MPSAFSAGIVNHAPGRANPSAGRSPGLTEATCWTTQFGTPRNRGFALLPVVCGEVLKLLTYAWKHRLSAEALTIPALSSCREGFVSQATLPDALSSGV